MDEKILRETFDHNLNESFRLKQLENGLSVFTVIKTTQTNLVTKSMEKPLFAHIRVTSRCNLKCAYCYAEDETTSTDMTDESILSVVKMCHIHGILCITWTGGEPLIRDNFYDTIKAKWAGNVVLSAFPAFSVTNLLLVQCSSAVLQCSYGCIRAHPFPLIYAP